LWLLRKRSFTLLLLLALIQISLVNAFDTVDVSPGKYNYKLGEGFPNEDVVKLNYPNSTILTNSTGELLFNVTLTTYNYTSEEDTDTIRKSISIYIPPEFTINNGVESVWTSYTNDYRPSRISLFNAFSNDPIAPNWSILSISNLNITKSHQDVKNRVFIENKTQYIRIFNVTSPEVAGRYFFKVFINIRGRTYSIGSHNFPTIVVSAALNPSYVSGTIRYGDLGKPDLYGKPLDSTVYPDGTVLLPEGYGGKIYAEGTTAEGKKIQAQAYFNSTAGKYTLYGLAAATYNITVHAAGYYPKNFWYAVNVAPDQGVEHLDFYMNEGVNVTGTVFSKCQFEKTPWGYAHSLTGFQARRVIKIDVTDINENIVASSPLKLFDKTLLIFRPRDTLDPTSDNYNFSIKREVLFDGHIPQDYANYTSGLPPGDYYVKAHVAKYVQFESTIVHFGNNTRDSHVIFDLQRTSHFKITVHFQDDPGKNPAPTTIGGYLYLEVLDATGAVVGFNVTKVPIGSSSFTMQVEGIDIWNRLMSDQGKRTAWVYSFDRGLLPGTYKINALFMNRTMDFIVLNSLIIGSPELRAVYPTTAEPLTSAFSARTLELTNRETPLYFQLMIIEASIGESCDNVVELSFAIVLGGGFDITIYSVDWQTPSIPKAWEHIRSEIRIDILNSKNELIDTIYVTQPSIGKSVSISTFGEILWEDGTNFFGRAIGLKSDSYILRIYTLGYLQESDPPTTIHVTFGALSDTPIYLYRGSKIDLILKFKTEQNFATIDNKLLYARPINNIDATPVRVEVFDEFGEFVAANITYVPRNSADVQITIYGSNNYYGNPRLLWTNFYDTTDGGRKLNSGLDLGKYQVRASIPGYYMHGFLTAEINSPNLRVVSVIGNLERLGYLSGNVTWANWLRTRQRQPLSWTSITAYQGNSRVFTYSLDGFYEAWLKAGTYDFGIYHPGLGPQNLLYGLHVSWGSCSSINFYMPSEIIPYEEESIPEYESTSMMPIMTFVFFIVLILTGRFKPVKTHALQKDKLNSSHAHC
jgi:hypothetical protein